MMNVPTNRAMKANAIRNPLMNPTSSFRPACLAAVSWAPVSTSRPEPAGATAGAIRPARSPAETPGAAATRIRS